MEPDRYEISILTAMWKRGVIGGRYQPVEQLMSKIPRDQHDQAREAMERLTRKGLVNRKKGGAVASLRTDRIDEIRDLLRPHVPDYLLELR